MAECSPNWDSAPSLLFPFAHVFQKQDVRILRTALNREGRYVFGEMLDILFSILPARCTYAFAFSKLVYLLGFREKFRAFDNVSHLFGIV